MPFACSLDSLSGWVLKSLTTNRIEGFTLYTRCNDKSKKRFDTETLQEFFGVEVHYSLHKGISCKIANTTRIRHSE